MLVELLSAFIFGGIVGVVLMRVRFSKTIDVGGVINIDHSDPDGPYLFLELNESVSELSTQEYVKFKIQNNSYISPE